MINATEVGKIFNYGTFFDLIAFTEMELKFTDPNGVETSILTPRISAPAVDVTDEFLGTLPASTYMQFTTMATDFITPGQWTVCGIYTDATPKVFFGDKATFTIGEVC